MKSLLPAGLLAVLLASLLGGCAGKQASGQSQSALAPSPLAPDLSAPEPAGSKQVVQSTLPPGVTGIVDGVYQGRERQIEARSPTCPPPQLGTIEIGDGTMLFPYAANLIYVVSVPPTGVLHAVINSTALDGQLKDGDLDFTITTPDCKSSFSFARRDGF